MKNFFKKDELKLLWPFYGDYLIGGIFIFFPAFYIIFLLDIGFSLTQIGLIMGVYAFTQLVFEIPTGAVADIYGRKFSVIIGAILSMIIYIIMFFANSFYLFIILFPLLGAAYTLISGAYNAWIVDLLKSKRKNDLIKEYFVKKQSFSSIALFSAGIAGALMVKSFGLKIIFPATAAGVLLGIIFLSFAQENFKRKKVNLKDQFKELFNHTKKAINYSTKHETVSILLIITLISMIAITFTVQTTWQPFFLERGFQEHWFGYLFSAAMVLGIFVPYLVKPLLKKTRKYKYYLMTVVIGMASMLFLTKVFIGLIPLVIIFMLYMSGYDFEHPAWNTFFHKHLPTKMRATIESLTSMIRALVITIIAPLVGFLADKFGPGNVIFSAGFIMLPIIYFYAKIKE